MKIKEIAENTFTFETNGSLSNGLMREVFYYVMELIENCASGENAEAPEHPPLLAEYLQSKK